MTPLIIGIGAVVGIAFLAYLVRFSFASRRDPLTPFARSAGSRRARRQAGLHVLRHEEIPPLADTPEAGEQRPV